MQMAPSVNMDPVPTGEYQQQDESKKGDREIGDDGRTSGGMACHDVKTGG